MAAICWNRAKKNGYFKSEHVKSSTATHCVEDEDGTQLNEAVQCHVSKEAEGGDQGTSSLSAQTRREKKVLFSSSSIFTLIL